MKYFQLRVFIGIPRFEYVSLLNAARLITKSLAPIYTNCLLFAGVSSEEDQRI